MSAISRINGSTSLTTGRLYFETPVRLRSGQAAHTSSTRLTAGETHEEQIKLYFYVIWILYFLGCLLSMGFFAFFEIFLTTFFSPPIRLRSGQAALTKEKKQITIIEQLNRMKNTKKRWNWAVLWVIIGVGCLLKAGRAGLIKRGREFFGFLLFFLFTSRLFWVNILVYQVKLVREKMEK